jgi:hypothetical protein
LTTLTHSSGIGVAVGGNVLEIDGGITTVDGMVMCVITVVGKLGNEVTGTKMIVDGIKSV